MRIEIALGINADLVAGFERLVPQLSSSNPPPSMEQLAAIVASPATDLIVAYDDDGGLVGSLTLVVFRIPTGLRARIEDVVVDEAARGQGVGEALSLAALDRARALGARTVDLTSRPSRAAANRLYQRLGFEQRETMVYRRRVDDDGDSAG
jgi:ribosomal protein S18 acetylase RimI-like enzyme